MRRAAIAALTSLLFSPVATADSLNLTDIRNEVCTKGHYTMKIGTNMIKLEGHEPYIAQSRLELPDPGRNLFYYIIIGEPGGALALGYIGKTVDPTKYNSFPITPIPDSDKAAVENAIRSREDGNPARVLSCP